MRKGVIGRIINENYSFKNIYDGLCINMGKCLIFSLNFGFIVKTHLR
jgi:hypothetical protein